MLGLSKCCRWTAGLASRMGASGLLRQVAVAAKGEIWGQTGTDFTIVQWNKEIVSQLPAILESDTTPTSTSYASHV